MSYRHLLKKLDYLERLIGLEHTGTAKELAARLDISRRTLFNYLELLRERGRTINFCRIRKTYFFQNK